MALTIGRTKDGHPAVKIRHMTFAMLPGRNSPLAIFSLWPAKNPENCIREDFSSFDRTVESEKEFVSYMEDMAEHYEDRKSVVEGKSVSFVVDLGGSRIIKKKKQKT